MRVTNYKEFLALSVSLFGISLVVWSVWGFIDRSGIVAQSNGGKSASTAAKEERVMPVTYNVKTIVDAHLFGKAEQKQQTVEQAPKTQLKLNLLGVLATDNSDYARALIQVQSNKMRAYAVGDVIEGTDAALHKVENQRVILDRQGKFESLVMARKNLLLAETPDQGIDQIGTAQGAHLNPTTPSPLPF